MKRIIVVLLIVLAVPVIAGADITVTGKQYSRLNNLVGWLGVESISECEHLQFLSFLIPLEHLPGEYLRVEIIKDIESGEMSFQYYIEDGRTIKNIPIYEGENLFMYYMDQVLREPWFFVDNDGDGTTIHCEPDDSESVS